MRDGQPVSVANALGMLDRALSCLVAVDAAGLPTSAQAEALLALERSEARHTAVRARLLGAFAAQGGYEDDGHGSACAWLRWRARITAGAAAGAVGWAPTRALAARASLRANPCGCSIIGVMRVMGLQFCGEVTRSRLFVTNDPRSQGTNDSQLLPGRVLELPRGTTQYGINFGPRIISSADMGGHLERDRGY